LSATKFRHLQKPFIFFIHLHFLSDFPGGKDDAEADEDAIAANTSHDDAEYHSNESGEETTTQGPPGTGTIGIISGSSNSSSGVSSVGYELHQDVLSLAIVYRSRETSTDHRIERSILTALGYTSSSGVTGLSPRNCDFSVRRLFVTDPAAATAAPNSLLARNNHPVAHYLLGNAALELIADQALVSAQLYGQDNLLTVKAVQVLVQHALRGQNNVDRADSGDLSEGSSTVSSTTNTSRECLTRLQCHNIHLPRALKIGHFLCKKNVETMVPIAPHFDLFVDEVILRSLNENNYAPHVGDVHL